MCRMGYDETWSVALKSLRGCQNEGRQRGKMLTSMMHFHGIGGVHKYTSLRAKPGNTGLAGVVEVQYAVLL